MGERSKVSKRKVEVAVDTDMYVHACAQMQNMDALVCLCVSL